jgi:hypothetical protein
MILYNNQEIKIIFEQVIDMKEFWRVCNLFMNICDEFPLQKTEYLYYISLSKYKKLIDEIDGNELILS